MRQPVKGKIKMAIKEAIYNALARFENGAEIVDCEKWALDEILEILKELK